MHTKLLEGESYNTLSSVVPSIMELNNHLTNFTKTDFEDINIIIEMKKQMDKRFSNIFDKNSINFDPIFITATLLDPKFALCLNESQISIAIKYIESHNLHKNNKQNEPQAIPEETAFSSIQNLILNVINENQISNNSDVCNEITSYLNYLKKQFLSDFNLKIEYFGIMSIENNAKLSSLEFWINKIIINKFPMITKFARQIQVIPATHASSERIFSISGDCLSLKRNLLKPGKLEREVMFIYNKNLLKI